MARALNPLSSEKASGSLGKVVTFKARRNTQVVARKSSPSQPQTAAQVARRAAFTQATQAWGSLSSANVQAWADYAAAHPVPDGMGGLVALPGYDVFVKCSMAYYFQYGSAPQSPITANHGLDLTNIVFASVNLGQLDYAWTWPSAAANGWISALWLQGPLANQHRALRQPEQRWNKNVIHPTASGALTGLTSGDWYYCGAQLIAPGVFPGPVHWQGPIEIA